MKRRTYQSKMRRGRKVGTRNYAEIQRRKIAAEAKKHQPIPVAEAA